MSRSKRDTTTDRPTTEASGGGQTGPGRRPVLEVATWVAGAMLLTGVVTAVGGSLDPGVGLILVVERVVVSGWAAAAYLLGGIGLGRVLWPAFRESSDPFVVQAVLGLTLLLSLTHLFGWIGVLGPVTAWVLVGAGLVLLADQGARALARCRASDRALPDVRTLRVQQRRWAATLVPGAVVLVVAACSPPGWFWASEFGGYDALSYHLQLPQEWHEAGKLRPLEHNVYSFLPGYVEAAFLHLASLTLAPRVVEEGHAGLLAGSGWRAISTQLLHAGMALLSAWVVARVTRRALIRGGAGEAMAGATGWIGGGLFLLTPWTVVVGSLAYNEMAVTLLGAGALLVALDPGLSPGRRGVLTGVLVGGACCAKPTALLLLGPVVGVALLAGMPRKAWLAAVGWGALAGVVVLAPWLIRNAVATGNPVFPFLSGVFGTGHWTPEQVARYAAAHTFEGGLLDRVRLMVFVDPDDPAGARHRGLMHWQWFLFFPAVVVGGAAALVGRRTRRAAVVLVLGIAAGLVAWLVATHVQSRFLVPLAVPGAVLAALGLGCLAGRGRVVRVLGAGLAACVLLGQAGMLLLTYGSQAGGQPNASLATGPGGRSGEAVRGEFDALGPAGRRQFLGDAPPEWYVNLGIEPGARVYLLGDAAAFYYRAPLLYHTTWDASPLGEAIRRHGAGNPRAWTRELVDDHGVAYVLVSDAELGRLSATGWYDPDVTPEVARAWMESSGELVREWQRRDGRRLAGLYRLEDDDASAGAVMTRRSDSDDGAAAHQRRAPGRGASERGAP